VVQFVAGCDVGQGADADFVVVDDASTRPGLLVQIAKKRECGSADGDVVFDDFSDRPMGRGAVTDVIVLLEAR